jgi:hypothetical protein
MGELVAQEYQIPPLIITGFHLSHYSIPKIDKIQVALRIQAQTSVHILSPNTGEYYVQQHQFLRK